jgi:acetyl esterase
MTLVRYVAKTLDWFSHTLPEAWTGAPVIAGERLDPFLHWVLILRAKRGAKPVTSVSPEATRVALRRELLEMRAGYPVGEVHDIEVPGAAGALRCRHYRPPVSGACDALIVYLHGGGFVLGDLDTHDDVCRLICRESGAEVLAVAYRLAPEHPFPAAVEDAEAATRWVLAHADRFGFLPERIAIGGDSAGGNLAIVTAEALAREGRGLAAQLIFYPATDTVTRRPSHRLFSKGLFLSNEDRAWFFRHYMQGGDGADIRVSPLLGNGIACRAPAVVVTAGMDVLHDEGVAYAAALEAKGMLLEHIDATDLTHGFANLACIHHRSDLMVVRAARRLRQYLAG